MKALQQFRFLLMSLFILPWIAGCRPPGAEEARDASASRPVVAGLPQRVVTTGWKATWSPDGTRIAYGLGQGEGIEILDLRTLARTNVLPKGKDPAWSPDGRYLAHVREPAHNNYQEEEVWIVETNGANPRAIGPGGFPSWSANGEEIYAHSRRDNSILAYAVKGKGTPPRVFLERALSWYPAISPDGQRVAFGNSGRLDIVDRASGTVVSSWPTPQDRGLLPAWSPDGKYVAFGGFDGSGLGLCVLDVAAAKAAVIVEGPHTMPAWSRDGKRLAFDLRTDAREVWVVGRDLVEARLADPAAAFSRDAAPEPSAPPQRPEPEPDDTTSLRGNAAPDITLPILDGGSFNLTELRGKVVVLDFWATWCPPCRRALPNLQNLSVDTALRERGLRVFAVDTKETEETVREYVQRNKLTLTVPMDKTGSVMDRYRVRGIPTTVVVDRKGSIQDVLVGFGAQTEQALDQAIQTALDKE